MKVQVTIFSNKGRRPISCLVNVDSLTKEDTKQVQRLGVQKICNKMRWEKFHLMEYGYTKVKVRPYEEGIWPK